MKNLTTLWCGCLFLSALLAQRDTPIAATSEQRLLAPRVGMAHLFGWYSSITHPSWLTDSRSSAINTVVVSSGPHTVLQPYLQRASARHIGVFLQPNARWIQEGKWTALANFVRRYRHFVSIRAWYLYDEPDHDGLPPDKLQHAYRLIKQLDRRPIAVVFMSGLCRFGRNQIDPRYVGSFDTLMFDYYPFWINDNSRDDLRRTLQVDHNCAATARALRAPFILVLQGFGRGVVEGGVRWRDPSSAELHFSYDAAIHSGALGVFFWAEYKADTVTRSLVERVLRQPGILPLSTQPSIRPKRTHSRRR